VLFALIPVATEIAALATLAGVNAMPWTMIAYETARYDERATGCATAYTRSTVAARRRTSVIVGSDFVDGVWSVEPNRGPRGIRGHWQTRPHGRSIDY